MDRGCILVGQRCIYYWFHLLILIHKCISPLSYSSDHPFSPQRPEASPQLAPPVQWGCACWKKCLNGALQSSREAECLLKAPAEHTAYSITVPSHLFIPPPTTFGVKWVVFVSAGRADGRGRYSMVKYFSVSLHLRPQPPIFFLLSERAGHRQSFRTVIALKPDIIKISFVIITYLRVSLQWTG